MTLLKISHPDALGHLWVFRREDDGQFVVFDAETLGMSGKSAEDFAKELLTEYDEAPGWQKTPERTLLRVGSRPGRAQR